MGAGFADRQYLRSHFGVPAGSASPLPAFDPKAGLYSVDAGVDVMVALSRHWVAVGGVSVSQLQGDARRSPLTVKPRGIQPRWGWHTAAAVEVCGHGRAPCRRFAQS